MTGVGVIGAGAWGTALAQLLASDGNHAVRLWARSPGLAQEINQTRANLRYLPGVALHPGVVATNDLGELAGLGVLLLVTPAQAAGAVLTQLPDFAGDLVLCAKGIEAGSGRLMVDVARQAHPRAQIAVLSGPTFAHEVAAGLPTAATLACSGGQDQWQRLAPLLARPAFRPYFSQDVIGAEIGGAVKNVLAVACGVVEGLGLGQNARAALISRGYAEMVRFGLACGADAETLTGLSGLGDLVLTCNSPGSRNFALGMALGQGASAAAVLAECHTVAEGAHTAPVLADLARARGIAMPIGDAVAALVSGTVPVMAVAEALLARPLRSELDQATMRTVTGRQTDMMGEPGLG
ncbi:NAD(P)H-dependent glycerol-3-phosphate dehydrogenase [Novosphingobium sp.]|uniref:NAD(P)H-dependent glycerol-3-phosphate dehydrogenase n=1 Tax=Novosphingobium sp. TaxID=1874826 RepID=UPI00333F5324